MSTFYNISRCYMYLEIRFVFISQFFYYRQRIEHLHSQYGSTSPTHFKRLFCSHERDGIGAALKSQQGVCSPGWPSAFLLHSMTIMTIPQFCCARLLSTGQECLIDPAWVCSPLGREVYDGRLQSAGFFKDYGSGRNNGPGGLFVRVRPDVDSLHRSDRRHHSRPGHLVCHHMQGMSGRLRYIGQEPGRTRHQGGRKSPPPRQCREALLAGPGLSARALQPRSVLRPP